VDPLRQWLKTRPHYLYRHQKSRVQTAVKWDSSVKLLMMKGRNGAGNVSNVASHAQVLGYCQNQQKLQQHQVQNGFHGGHHQYLRHQRVVRHRRMTVLSILRQHSSITQVVFCSFVHHSLYSLISSVNHHRLLFHVPQLFNISLGFIDKSQSKNAFPKKPTTFSVATTLCKPIRYTVLIYKVELVYEIGRTSNTFPSSLAQ